MNEHEKSQSVLEQELEAAKMLVHDLQAKLSQYDKKGPIRQRSPREDLKSPVEFIGDFDIVHAEGINISEDGISFFLKKPLPVEMHYLQNGMQEHRRAHLVWMKHEPDEGYRFGLKFVESENSGQF